ncbi:hypothetical protein AB4455_09855 [Vibrio sp. 10N.261.46.E12]|uniref:hypothetical protein n=1 Tax=unclassified Vibrio TaxID=2614977 RepID=UPI0009776DBE|nr:MULTISPECIES: hypothetical protein [unclassified Vibrio]OMO37350.1 hypothetical protein BH584_23400 [Vibrio sp. 10N.261.45.E1]PMJ21947.1 hypothetical protein BCU27_17270 [Vibrio sp. 10N.286.45.B6]PML90587.1 hypothetical protein BCT66_04865 [Vibrio sp. 10N.261.49.E11]PMM72100.1 hypothetical protein BCT48_07455 [Vibrio sp. 10N.261.46.F12]PMM80659.1 hypothetical protein BCT46_17725 [Vibrio sp. 10N.261.46.E8]
MNRITWVVLAPLLLSMAMVFRTFIYGSEGYVEAITVSLVLSAPLIFTFVLVALFCRDSVSDRYVLLETIAICGHLFTVMLHVLWNGFMLADVINKDGLGPAQGYSGLILWVGSIKAMLLGVVVGICLHYVPRIFRKLAVR